jgi:hypothetical protein
MFYGDGLHHMVLVDLGVVCGWLLVINRNTSPGCEKRPLASIGHFWIIPQNMTIPVMSQ